MRIRSRILLAVLFVVAIATGVYSQFVIQKERSEALAHLRETIEDADRLLGIVLARPLHDGDVKQLNVLLDALFHDPNLTSLELREHRSDIRLNRSRESARDLGTALESRVSVTKGADVLGEVRSTYSTARIEQHLQDSRHRHVGFSLGLMLGLLVVTYFVAAGLARPIARLDSAAQAAARGDWSRPVVVGGARELVSLGASFVRMRDAIHEKIAALNAANERLREEVEQRKQAQQEVARQATMLEATPDFVGSADASGRVLHVNRAGLHLLGRGDEEHPTRLRIADFHSPEMARFVAEQALPAAVAQGVWSGETRLRHRQGHEITVSQVIVAHRNRAGEIEYFSTIARDISERKRAEAELLKRENRLALLVTSMPAVIYACRPNGDFGATFVSGTVETQLGYRAREFLEDPAFWMNHVHPDDRARVLHGVGSVSAQHAHVHEYRFQHRDGTYRWMRDEVRLLLDASGRPAEMIGCWSDITERRRAEDALRGSEARYRLLFESNPHPMWVYELETLRFLAVNDAAVVHYGYSRAEFLAMTIKDIRPPEELPRLLDNVRQVTEGLDEAGVWRHIKRNGEVIMVEITSHVLTFDDRRAELVLVNDITERKQLESQYLRAQRLESVGTLASGVAHDLNNILSPIVIGLEMLIASAKDEETRGVLAMMQESARRGRDTIKQLLIFARGGESQKGPVQPRHVLGEIARLLQQTFPKNIQIHTDFARDPATVLADPSQLHQVLMNLCVNARDAMSDGGVLYLTLATKTLDASTANLHPKARPGPYVVFQVADSGVGIPPDVMDRIFDPFFTTKPQGMGTGLGLATALGIVENHGGFVTVQSKLARGTTFEVYIPSTAAIEGEGAKAEPPSPLRGGGELVLVVDDEPAILRMAESVLRRSGYETLGASSASAALQLFEENRDRLRVVLTDIMMPLGDGRQLIAMLHTMDPKLPIIAMSGHATREFQREALSRGAQVFLSKPFSTEQLLAPLSELLQRRSV